MRQNTEISIFLLLYEMFQEKICFRNLRIFGNLRVSET
jgi:hypothetical protein